MTDEKKFYCPQNAEYGWVEAQFETEKEAQDWIGRMYSDDPDVDPDTYRIIKLTQAELDALPED